MKEINNTLKIIEKNSIEIPIKKQKEIEYHFEGQILPNKGHLLFEINPKTLEINLAEYKSENTYIFGQPIKENKKVIKKKGFVYISALNSKNALKRFKKGKGSSVITNHLKKTLL